MMEILRNGFNQQKIEKQPLEETLKEGDMVFLIKAKSPYWDYSPRLVQILALAALGYYSQEIAGKLGLSYYSVKATIYTAFDKLEGDTPSCRPESIVCLLHRLRQEKTVYFCPSDDFSLSTLSPQRRKVLSLKARGLSVAQIAKQLCIQPATVRNTLTAGYEALGIKAGEGSDKIAGKTKRLFARWYLGIKDDRRERDRARLVLLEKVSRSGYGQKGIFKPIGDFNGRDIPYVSEEMKDRVFLGVITAD